jgi:hypothetical protein
MVRPGLCVSELRVVHDPKFQFADREHPQICGQQLLPVIAL